MKIVLFLIAFLLAARIFSGCTESTATATAPLATAPLPEPPPPLDPELQAFLDDFSQYFSDTLLLSGTPGSALVIVKDSQVVFLRGYGVRALGEMAPVDERTLFRIGSLSKGFAGVLTGILVKNGQLKWDDPVQQHYPGFQLKDEKQAQRVQIRHLLSHTCGLPYHAFDNLVEQGFDRETIITQYFPPAKLFGKEGAFFAYQNVAFCAIEPVMQAATGRTYPALLEEYIFRPAGMTGASTDFETMKNAPNAALPHDWQGEAWAPDTISANYYGFTAAGGVNASAADMGEWLKVLLGHRQDIIDNATLDEVFHPVVATGLERRTLPGWIERDSAFYAMGWRILLTGDDTLVYHAGMVNNFHSEIALSRRDGIGICVLFNAGSPVRGKCIQAFFEKWKALQLEKSTAPLPGPSHS